MFKGYGDEHHPMVEEWRTGYGYEALEALQGSLCVCTQIIRACVVL